MHEVLLHPSTSNSLGAYLRRPTHAIVLHGPAGIGKKSIARGLAAELLNTPVDHIGDHPHVRIIQSGDAPSISIESIRSLKAFISLKIPGPDTIARVIIICNADAMTTEAQNSLLKTLEEPPENTVIIMTTARVSGLLSTVTSRSIVYPVLIPEQSETESWFTERGYPADLVKRSILLSGGLPGLVAALLTSQQTHPLYEATILARKILGNNLYERLLIVDTVSKQKRLTQDIMYIIGHMSRTMLQRDMSRVEMQRWQRIMKSTYRAEKQMQSNVQAKLVVTNLMLAL